MKATFIAISLALIGNSVQAGAAEKVAFAYCPMTHVMGHGRAANLVAAEDNARNDCAMKGGIPSCCAKFYGEDTKAERAQVVGEADRKYGTK